MTQSKKVKLLLSLLVPQVDVPLDWSWLVDLGQGNFAVANLAAQQALSTVQDSDTLFTRALVHQLQGEYTQAIPLFEAAYQASSNPNRKFIIASIAYLGEHQGCSLEPGQAKPNQFGYARDSKWKQRTEELMPQVSEPYAQLQGSYCQLALWIPAFGGTISEVKDEAKGAEYLNNIESEVRKQLELAISLDAERIIQGLYSLLVNLLAVGGKIEEAFTILARLKTVYLESGDFLGLGWSLLSVGDLIASPGAFGKPILFGYARRDRSESNQVASKEQMFDSSIIHRLNAHEFYLEARQYLAAAGALRGEGMAILRLAYLDAIANKLYLSTQGYEEARRIFADTGDRLNFIAAAMGKLWTGIQLGEQEESSIAKIEAICRVLKQNGANAYGLNWGVAFAHAGEEARLREDLDTAVRAERLAIAIFAVLDRQQPPSQSNFLEQ